MTCVRRSAELNLLGRASADERDQFGDRAACEHLVIAPTQVRVALAIGQGAWIAGFREFLRVNASVRLLSMGVRHISSEAD